MSTESRLAAAEITTTFKPIPCADCLRGLHRWSAVQAETYAAVLTRWHCSCSHCYCDARKVKVGRKERSRRWRLLRRVQRGLELI
ncbi:hypothetical protein BJ970_007314 [Saccharopolyspora phatthalungensis]|uniref:Uncharacterized protein n=1 Tax=Saccharopolyspora phatthalungensis TaxID=664693 RepID=A0A840QK97_9PSEU|nr:hypothetical protein [Saccharopolyspora phatthalungensis]